MTPLEIFLTGVILGLLLETWLLRSYGQSQNYRG